MNEEMRSIIIRKMIYIRTKYKNSKSDRDIMLSIPRKRGKYIENEMNKILKI